MMLRHAIVSFQEPDVELPASADVDPTVGLANWTTSRKYVISRPRICNEHGTSVVYRALSDVTQ